MSVRSVSRNMFPLLLVLLIGQPFAFAQVDYTREEYDRFQSAVNADLATREDAIVEFIKSNQSSLVPHAVKSYVQLLLDYRNKGQWQKVVSAGDKFLAIQPEDINALNITAYGAYQLKQFAKAARYWEKVYRQKPDPQFAPYIARSYIELKNEDKVIEYGEKACAELAPKDCYDILGELIRIYASRTQWSKAAEYANKAIAGFDAASKGAQTSDRDWKAYINQQKAVAHAVLGRQAAERQRWNTAISNYQKALSLHSDPAPNGEAYYFIGMGRWKQNRIDPAMEAFARGSVQRGAPHARRCRQYLETLYKSTHNDSLAGIEEFIERVSRRRR
ncbi:tetratricopeptide repeat protein [Acidobacteria bacterium AH-259-O06]|nr:tetratricopeptide repeat protein [Acidobacteria bacterium AH-259-O06]